MLDVLQMIARGGLFVVAVLFYIGGYVADAAFWMAALAVMYASDRVRP